jgi:hypothetical protein
MTSASRTPPSRLVILRSWWESFPGGLALKLQHGQQFAQPPGRYASPMDSADVAVFYAGQRAGEALETGAEQIGTSW